MRKKESANGFNQTSYRIWIWSEEKSNRRIEKKASAYRLTKPHIEYENEAEEKGMGEWEKKNRQTDLTKPHIEYEHETKEKVIAE